MYVWFKINDEWKICEIGTPCGQYFEENPIQPRIIEENDLGTLHAWDDEICGKIVERYFVVLHNPKKAMIFVEGRIKTKSGGTFTGEVFLHLSNDTESGKRWIRKNRECLPLDSDVSPETFIIVPPTFRSSGFKRSVHAEKGMRWTLINV